jgi:hypothetical protein
VSVKWLERIISTFALNLKIINLIQVSQKWRTNYLLPYRGCLNVLSVDIKSWDIINLLIVYRTFELSLKIKIVIKEVNFNLMFLTVRH